MVAAVGTYDIVVLVERHVGKARLCIDYRESVVNEGDEGASSRRLPRVYMVQHAITSSRVVLCAMVLDTSRANPYAAGALSGDHEQTASTTR